MKNDNIPGNHRGSSPPFQDPEQEFYKWMNGLKSLGQRDEKASQIQQTVDQGNQRKSFPDLKGDPSWGKNPGSAHRPPSGGESDPGTNDESRWQDDGGESGEKA